MTGQKYASLRLRLALLFALASAVLFALMGAYVFNALEREVAYRDDMALLGRIDRIKNIIKDNNNIDLLKKQPKIYSNMLGNKDNALWIMDGSGALLIEVNPENLPTPVISELNPLPLFTTAGAKTARMAWKRINNGDSDLFIIASKLLAEREQMMAAYRWNLGAAWMVGVLLAFAVGWEVVRRGLFPLHRLSQQAAAVSPQHLGLRLDEQKQPQELQALTAALNLMLARLEQGYAKLGQFSEDLAHEMRTPLNNLMLQNQLALSQPRTFDDYAQLLDSQQEEYERLARMIDNMLFLARAEKQDAALQLESVDLEKLFQQLSGYFEGMAQERGIRIEATAHGHLSADSSLVRRALANLLANAIRYGEADTVVTLRCNTPSPKWLDIEVLNQGAPIAEEHLPRIFDRFYRCDASRSHPDDSGGLGLAIVQSIMHMHGGEVVVSSTDAGTQFSLRFPRRD
ncbi:two-component system heavy metal sensor histidine kinase CusS [Comamonas sp. BIGb0152]|uniref:heavy metal sensor histidine kinase n=1 Tax=Comamonas sp. BIGb0152 TaxID=2940601 RepID=UPI002169AA1E|nr:heavy metal sensor histidine kinase [Comamonas sp. BIGb0152]MCS4295737.1 two-component system heavy metal sensor histidine kinase CusS [Comamonas sp. BIGb0152]